MHSAMMRAPREMRSNKRPPFNSITRKVPTMVRNSTNPIMIPGLRPIATRSTTTTIVTALIRLKVKAAVASVTAVG